MIRLDLQPHLVGSLIELRPMRPDDWQELYAVAADPLVWEVHPARDRYKEDRFREYFREGLESGGALVAVERETGRLSAHRDTSGMDQIRTSLKSAGHSWPARTGVGSTTAR